MRKSKYIVPLLILFLLFSLSAGAIVRVEPTRIILFAEPGGRETGTIEVINKGEEEAEVWAVLYDWQLDDKESLITLPAGETDVSLDGLIKFNPRYFKIMPGEKQVIRFTVTASENINKEKRGIVFFEEKTNMIDDKTGARIVTQVGTTIYFIPSTAVSKFQILMADIHLAENEDEENVGLVLVKNAGDVHIRYTVNYKIINEKGSLITEGKLKEELLLPGKRKGLGFPIKEELKAGNYKMIINITFSKSDKISEYEVPFTIEEGK